MKTLPVKYVGAKAPRTFPLPLPLLSKSSQTGDVTFTGPGSVQEIDAEQARRMCEEFPSLFELAAEKGEKKSLGKSGDSDVSRVAAGG